jgi:hypothetical protein
VLLDIFALLLKQACSENGPPENRVDSTVVVETLRQTDGDGLKGKLLVGEKVAAAIKRAVM